MPSEVVRLCSGLPLAIKVLAARAKTSTMDDVLREIRDRHGISDEVNAAFELSYRQLPAEARRLFRDLGATPCADVTLVTVAALADITERAAATSLTALCEQSLLQERSPGRFALHDLLREYAKTLSRADDREPAIRRLADHYVREAERAAEILESRDHISAIGMVPRARTVNDYGDAENEWFTAEYENILLLAEYCDKHERKRYCSRLVNGVSGFLATNGHWEQARRAHKSARKACRSMNDIHGVAKATYALSLTCLRTGCLDDAYDNAAEAKVLFGRAGDRCSRAEATDLLGVVCRHQARFRAALAHHEEAVDIFRICGDSAGAAHAMLHAATALHMLGRLPEEMTSLNEALGIFRRLGNLRGQAIARNSIGLIHLSRGYHRDAVSNFRSSYGTFRSIGGRQSLAVLDHNMGKVYQYRGRRDEALTMYGRALAQFRAMGDLRNEALVRTDIGSIRCESETYPDALDEYNRVLAIAELMGDSYTCVLALCGIADAKRESDSLDVAVKLYGRAGQLATQIEAEYPKALALHGMAEAMLLRNDEDAARIHWREALRIYRTLGSHLSGIVLMRLEAFHDAA